MRSALALRPALAALFLASLSPPLLAGAGDFGRKWSHMGLGDQYGRATLELADFDRDGYDDVLVAGCSGSCWVVLGAGGQGYRQIATSLQGTSIDLLNFARLEDGAAVLSTRGAALEITTWAGGALTTRSITLATGTPADLGIADLDGDGDLELVVVDALDLFVQDLATGSLLATKLGFGGMDLDLGQFDSDPAREIAIATGLGACWVLDGLTLDTDWGTPSGFGTFVEFGAFEPDAGDELLTGSPASWPTWTLTAWNPPAAAPLWESSPVSLQSPSVVVLDLDPAPGEEVLLGGQDSPSLVLLRGSDGVAIGGFPYSSVVGFGVGDTDLDGQPELVISQGSTLLFVDAASGGVEHRTRTYWVQSLSVAAGDLDGDGDVELVAGAWSDPESSFDGPFANAAIFSVGPGGGPDLRHLSETRWWGMISQFRIADVDGDAALEICADYSVGYSYVGCYEGADLAPIWSAQLFPMPAEMILADLVGDSRPELLVSREWSYYDSWLDAFEAQSGTPLWGSPNLAPETSGVDLLCLGEIDASPGPDLVAGDGTYGDLSFLEPADGSIVRVLHSVASGGLECGDLDGDGDLELVGTDDVGTLGVLDPQTGGWLYTIADLGDYVNSLALGDLVGDGRPEIAVSWAGGIRVLDSITGLEVWSIAGAGARLEILDADGDGLPDLVATTGGGMVVFGRPYSGRALFVDGFESGDAIFWSRARS